MAIRLYQTETSMFCEKVRIVLAHKKIPYEKIDVRKDDRKSLIEFSKQRKVPVMDYDGQCVIDSTYITAFLEQRHPQNSIYPDGASEKGLCLILEDWADEVLNLAIRTLRRADSDEARARAESELGIHFGTLDQFLAGKGFIFGKLTVADAAIFTQLHYLYTVVKREIPAAHANLRRWMEFMRRALDLASLEHLVA
jgi:glutathione S-transferase